MYDEEYYEQFEPMPEHLEKIQSLVSGYAKTVAKDIVSDNEYLKTQNKKLLEDAVELRKLKKKITELENDLQKKHKSYSKDCALEYLANEAGLDGVKYGDTLYVIDSKFHTEVCTDCNGAKKVKMSYKGQDTEVKCPKCGGNHAYTFYTYHLQEMKVVGFSVTAAEDRDTNTSYLQTQLTLSNGSKNSYGETVARNFSPCELNSKNYYSGWYKTKEDAIKYCEKEVTDLTPNPRHPDAGK